MQKLQELIETAERLKLYGREILDRYSETELLCIYNGLGPDRFPDWLRAIITEASDLFEPAALIHDVRYHEGGSYEDFTLANSEFRENCYTLVADRYSWYNPRRYRWYFRAWRYAEYCQEFGWEGYTKR